MTQEELKRWASQKRAEIIVKNAKPGMMVQYAGSMWECAGVKQFPHGPMIGIYDEPPSKHVDYLNPQSITIPLQQ